MRLLANENVPALVIRSIRGAGHDIKWVRESRPGAPDPDVLGWATAEQRILLTFDLDFGELAFRQGLAAECGIIILRLPMQDVSSLASRVVEVLATNVDWVGHLAVVEPDRIRVTRIQHDGTPRRGDWTE